MRTFLLSVAGTVLASALLAVLRPFKREGADRIRAIPTVLIRLAAHVLPSEEQPRWVEEQLNGLYELPGSYGFGATDRYRQVGRRSGLPSRRRSVSCCISVPAALKRRLRD